MSIIPFKKLLPSEKPSNLLNENMNKQVSTSITQMTQINKFNLKKKSNISTIKIKDESEKIFRIAETKIDPFNPSRFRNRKPIPEQQEDPDPILTKPIEKLSKDDEKYWSVPPCVSQWKNPTGNVIPLDTRIGIDSRRFQIPDLSTRHSILTQSLDATMSAINESNSKKALLERQLLHKKQLEEEERQRQEVLKLREEKLQILSNKDEEEFLRQKLLEHHRLQKESVDRQIKKRDVSEEVALGKTITNTELDDIHDERLYGSKYLINTNYGEDEGNDFNDFLPKHKETENSYIPFGGSREYSNNNFQKNNQVAGPGGFVFVSGPKQTPNSASGLVFPT